MINLEKIKTNLKNDNHKVYQKLLIETSEYSKDNPELSKAVEDISKQMNNMVEIIEYFIEGEKNNG